MGAAMDLLISAEEDAALSAPDMQAWLREQERGRAAAEAAEQAVRARRESVWATRHPAEWEEWQRVRPLLDVVIDFLAEHPFDFDDFLREVGRRPTHAHAVDRVDEARPFEQGNLAWVPLTTKPAPSPHLNVEQAADYLGVAVQTIYNNRKYIPSLPGFRTLMFDPKVLDEVRASVKFRNARLTEQRRKRVRKSTS